MTLHPTSARRATLAPAAAVATGAALLLSAFSPAGPASAQDELACDAEPVVMTTADGVDFVRTPDACFDRPARLAVRAELRRDRRPAPGLRR